MVGHPAVVSVNQEVYRELLASERWEVEIVLPSSWKHPYSDGAVAPEVLPGMEKALRPTPVAFAGRQQRHLYLTLGPAARGVWARRRLPGGRAVLPRGDRVVATAEAPPGSLRGPVRREHRPPDARSPGGTAHPDPARRGLRRRSL
ncbi:MAG TPA: hypothetical protein VKH20_05520 [Solirubrobacterales bacterium]|nr:hypothetical protein [Solirubrobacterales bacterium]